MSGRKLDESNEIRELLLQKVRRPPSDVTFGEETEQLPDLFGGLSVALARSFRVIDPRLTHPATGHWERAFDRSELSYGRSAIVRVLEINPLGTESVSRAPDVLPTRHRHRASTRSVTVEIVSWTSRCRTARLGA